MVTGEFWHVLLSSVAAAEGRVGVKYLSEDAADPKGALHRILTRVGAGGTTWSIIRFAGIEPPLGEGPLGLSDLQFDMHLSGNATGLLIPRKALVAFALRVHAVRDCEILSASSVAVLTAARLCADDAECDVVIRRRDQGRWTIRVGRDEKAIRARIPETPGDTRHPVRWRERAWPTSGGVD